MIEYIEADRGNGDASRGDRLRFFGGDRNVDQDQAVGTALELVCLAQQPREVVARLGAGDDG
jgi:hypothetical protein